MVKVYCYERCTTCKKALKWLDDNDIKYKLIDIKKDNPNEETLRKLHAKSNLSLRKFFNTSGQLYREMQLSKKLDNMSEDEMFKLLASDGMLVKRPLLVTDKKVLAGFKEAMKRHGLDVPKDRIIEGDFWYLSGEQCVESLVASGKKLPDAIVCANDQMAIGVCKAFDAKGIRVPEDVMVVGADANGEGLTCPKVLTSYNSPVVELGSYAVDVLDDIKNGNPIREFEAEAEIIYGETCGCTEMKDYGYSLRKDSWLNETYEEGFDSINNVIFESLMIQNDILEYIGTVYSYAYQIKDVDSFSLCLVKDILRLGIKEPRRNDGYGKQMIYALKYSKDQLGDIVGLDRVFDTEEMLPDLFEDREKPKAFFFTPFSFAHKPKTTARLHIYH